jgi:hypothetical protein
MTNDQNTEPRNPDTPPIRNRPFLWLVFGLAPIPIGLLLGPANIFHSSEKRGALFILYFVIGGLCSFICGIGQANGFQSKRAGDITRGLLAGAVLAFVNLFVVFSAGCCSAFGEIH